MPVLSRRERERVRLGNSIVVTIVRVSGDKVRLGIEAPPDILVLRDELEALEPPAAATNLEVKLDVPSKSKMIASTTEFTLVAK